MEINPYVEDFNIRKHRDLKYAMKFIFASVEIIIAFASVSIDRLFLQAREQSRHVSFR